MMCTETPLFEEVQQPKKIAPKPGNDLSDALQTSRFQKFMADAATI